MTKTSTLYWNIIFFLDYNKKLYIYICIYSILTLFGFIYIYMCVNCKFLSVTQKIIDHFAGRTRAKVGLWLTKQKDGQNHNPRHDNVWGRMMYVTVEKVAFFRAISKKCSGGISSFFFTSDKKRDTRCFNIYFYRNRIIPNSKNAFKTPYRPNITNH